MREAIGRWVLALVGLVSVALVAAACSADTTEFTGTRLENPYQAADIPLTDTDGAPYSLVTDTDKPLTLVFFGYTSCPDYCPMVMNNIAAALNRLDADDREQVDLVFVTTDPSTDTPEVLREYLNRYEPEAIGLTGELETIIEVGKPLYIYVNDGEVLPSGGYDLGGHTTATLAIDSSNQAIALWNQETSSTEFAADIHTLLAEDD